MDYSSDEEDYLEVAERNAKRNFLREEIIEMNYDPQLFTQYLENQKAADIDAWTFDELHDCVREFKNKYRAGQTLEEIEEQERQEKEKEKRLYEIPVIKKAQSSEENQQKSPKKAESPPPPKKEKKQKEKEKPKKSEPTPSPPAPPAPSTLSVPTNERDRAPSGVNTIKGQLLDSSVHDIAKEEKNKPKYYTETPIHNIARKTAQGPQKLSDYPAEDKKKYEYQPKLKATPEPPLIATKPKEETKISEPARFEPLVRDEEESRSKRNEAPQAQPSSDYSETTLVGETYEISAQLVKETELSRSQNPTVEVPSFETVEAGFFGSNYVVYKITTNPFGWEVKRRYSEFAMLREVLANSFPGYYIPPLPEKKATGKTDQMIAIKRQKFLQRYMNSILANRMLRTSTFLVQFLKEFSSREWNTAKEQNKKVKKLDGLKTYPSFDGYLHCNTSDQTALISKMNDHLSYSETIKKKLKRHFETVIEDFSKISVSLAASVDLIKQLADVQSILNFNTDQQYVYDSLKEAISQWSEHEKEQSQFISDYFYMFFKYGYMESGALKELLRERENLMGSYKKSNSVKTGTDKIKDIFGYHNTLSLSETERVIKETKSVACEHFGELARNESNHAVKLRAIWDTLLSKMLETSERINRSR